MRSKEKVLARNEFQMFCTTWWQKNVFSTKTVGKLRCSL